MCKHKLKTEMMQISNGQVLVIKGTKSWELGKTGLKNNKEQMSIQQSQNIPGTELLS